MKALSNKKIGNDLESKVLDLLKQYKIWGVKLKEQENGAPFDLIASKNNVFYGLEVKNIEHGARYPLSRVEMNQEMSIHKLNSVGTSNTFFVFGVKSEFGVFKEEYKEIYIVHSSKVLVNDVKSIDVKGKGELFTDWLKKI